MEAEDAETEGGREALGDLHILHVLQQLLDPVAQHDDRVPEARGVLSEVGRVACPHDDNPSGPSDSGVDPCCGSSNHPGMEVPAEGVPLPRRRAALPEETPVGGQPT